MGATWGATVQRSYAAEYERTRRSEVPKGTREASAVARLKDPSAKSRKAAEDLARLTATKIWEEKWGEIPTEPMEVIIWHLSFEVLVAVREIK
jgi:hypothetical protein